MTFQQFWQYLKYVLRHKWYVFLEGRKFHVGMLTLLLHDWDKFLPDEFIPYAKFFHEPDGGKRQRRDKTGYYKPDDTGDVDFDFAWFLHQKRNKHHWQYWCYPRSDGSFKVLPIPVKYVWEMVADWRGAGRAQGTPDTRAWYATNRDKIILHPDTRVAVEVCLHWIPEIER